MNKLIKIINQKAQLNSFFEYQSTVENIINMMLALHSDHQKQMMNVINMMSVSEREMSIAILQKNSIKTKNIHEKLNKLQVLLELNECRNNELML